MYRPSALNVAGQQVSVSCLTSWVMVMMEIHVCKVQSCVLYNILITSGVFPLGSVKIAL